MLIDAGQVVRDYIEALESRIKTLEAALREIHGKASTVREARQVAYSVLWTNKDIANA